MSVDAAIVRLATEVCIRSDRINGKPTMIDHGNGRPSRALHEVNQPACVSMPCGKPEIHQGEPRTDEGNRSQEGRERIAPKIRQCRKKAADRSACPEQLSHIRTSTQHEGANHAGNSGGRSSD